MSFPPGPRKVGQEEAKLTYIHSPLQENLPLKKDPVSTLDERQFHEMPSEDFTCFLKQGWTSHGSWAKFKPHTVHAHSFIHTVVWLLWCTYSRVKELQQSWKYLLRGPFQKMVASPAVGELHVVQTMWLVREQVTRQFMVGRWNSRRRGSPLCLHTSAASVSPDGVFWAPRRQVTAPSEVTHLLCSVHFPSGPHAMSGSCALIHQQALGGN